MKDSFPDNPIELALLKEDIEESVKVDSNVMQYFTVLFDHAINFRRTRRLKRFLESTGIWAQYQYNLALKEASKKILPFDLPDDVHGDIDIGITLDEKLAGLLLSILTMHIYLCAGTGTGKTSLLRRVIHQLLNITTKLVLWIFDLKGIDFTDLYRSGVRIIFLSEVYENPLDLPNFSTLFCQAYFLQSASHKIDEALEELKKQKSRPTLHDLAKYIDHKLKNTKIWRETTLLNQISDRLHTLLKYKGKAYSVPRTPDFEKLYRTTVFVNDIPCSKTATFTTFCLCERAYQYHREKGFIGDGARLGIILEDANLLDPLKNYSTPGWDRTYLPDLVQIGRELMIFWIFSSSQPIPDSFTVNTNTKIIGAQNTGEQRSMVANSLALNSEQRQFLAELDVGEFLVKTPNHPSAYPITALPPLPKNPLTRTELELACEQGLEQITPHTNKTTSTAKSRIPLTEPELTFLTTLSEHPFANYTELLLCAGLSIDRGKPARESLIRKGLVTPRNVHGKKSMFFELSEVAINEFLDGKSPYTGKGSFEHRYWTYKISEYLESIGYSVHVEHLGADIVVAKGSSRFAVEVTLSHDNILDNHRRNEKNNLSTILAVRSKPELFKVQSTIQDQENVMALLFKDILAWKENANE